MNPWTALLIGVVLGWLIEFAIDWLFWRRKTSDEKDIEQLQAQLQAAEARIVELEGGEVYTEADTAEPEAEFILEEMDDSPSTIEMAAVGAGAAAAAVALDDGPEEEPSADMTEMDELVAAESEAAVEGGLNPEPIVEASAMEIEASAENLESLEMDNPPFDETTGAVAAAAVMSQGLQDEDLAEPIEIAEDEGAMADAAVVSGDMNDEDLAEAIEIGEDEIDEAAFAEAEVAEIEAVEASAAAEMSEIESETAGSPIESAADEFQEEVQAYDEQGESAVDDIQELESDDTFEAPAESVAEDIIDNFDEEGGEEQ